MMIDNDNQWLDNQMSETYHFHSTPLDSINETVRLSSWGWHIDDATEGMSGILQKQIMVKPNRSQ